MDRKNTLASTENDKKGRATHQNSLRKLRLSKLDPWKGETGPVQERTESQEDK